MAANPNPGPYEKWARKRNMLKGHVIGIRDRLKEMSTNPIMAYAERDVAKQAIKRVQFLIDNWELYNDYSRRKFISAWRREQKKGEQP